MTRHIEGFCNFEEGDQLIINGAVMANITSDGNYWLFIEFTFSNERIFAGKKGDESTDNIINAVWNTLRITHNF